jgi:hypothetical protein
MFASGRKQSLKREHDVVVAAGTIDANFDIVWGAIGLLSSGDVRGLAVTSPNDRWLSPTSQLSPKPFAPAWR